MQHDITIEQGATFTLTVTVREPSGTDAGATLTIGSQYYVNGYETVRCGDNFFQDGAVFEATATTYAATGGGTLELMQPRVLTGYTVAGKIKDRFGGTVQATFVCTITDAANGIITISLTAAVTAALTAWRKAFYDIELTKTSTSAVTRILQGHAVFSEEITT